MMRALPTAALALFVLAAAAEAQKTTPCDLSTRGSASDEYVNGLHIARGGGGITVTCKSRGITLVADSGETFGDDRVELYGKVHYSEPTRIDLRSDRLSYFVPDERINVRGHVVATLPSGSALVGPEATYLRVAPKIRTIEELTAIGTPTMTVAAKSDSGKPVTVTATTLYMRGDSLIYASKSVVITRSDLIARGDSAFLDGRAKSESIRLMFKPAVAGTTGRKFRLEGDIIDAYSKDQKLDRVIARGSGHAVSQEMDILADTIDLRMKADTMVRAIAWNAKGQARAKAPSETITADSIDVRMPGQKVRIVYAVRHARADADPDTVRFRTKERDWLRGDAVTAWFDSTNTKDTATTPPLQRILATHHADSAQAYYHLAPTDTAVREPAISYVRGREIRIDFSNRQVGVVTVTDSVSGIYAEPRKDSTKATAKPGAKPAVKAGAGKSTPAKTPAKPPATTPVKRPPPMTGREERL